MSFNAIYLPGPPPPNFPPPPPRLRGAWLFLQNNDAVNPEMFNIVPEPIGGQLPLPIIVQDINGPVQNPVPVPAGTALVVLVMHANPVNQQIVPNIHVDSNNFYLGLSVAIPF